MFRRSTVSHACHVSVIAWLIGLSLSADLVMAQELTVPENTELVELLAAARKYELRTTKPNAPLKLREPPVLNFTNPERNQERGSVLVWLQDGRPAVIGQFFCFNSRDQRVTKHAFHSLVSMPLEAKIDDVVAWSPQDAGIEWKPFANAPPVGPNRTNRLLQMRQLARQFRVTLMESEKSSTELRLAPRPLFEYSAPNAGATDGVILSFVVATDPEAILLIEAFDEKGQTGFRYAFARFHFRRLTASLDDQTVWDVEYDASMMRNSRGNPATIKKVYNSFYP